MQPHPVAQRRQDAFYLPTWPSRQIGDLALALACGIQSAVKSKTNSPAAILSRRSFGLSALLLACCLILTVNAEELVGRAGTIPLRAGLDPDQRLTAQLTITNLDLALLMYAELTGRQRLPATNSFSRALDQMSGGRLSRWRILHLGPIPDSGLTFHGDGFYSAAEVKAHLEKIFRTHGLTMIPWGKHGFYAVRLSDMGVTNGDQELAARTFMGRSHDRRLKLYMLILMLALLFGTAALRLRRRFYRPDRRLPSD
jgi:hypothetical protein